MAKRMRVDVLMVERGLAESRTQAQRLVMAGQVRVGGEVVSKPSQQVNADSAIALEALPRFVSRGGEKLEAALQAFGIEVEGAVCADVGSSTGGFTDCLLQRGAAKVHAIDVGRGQLHWKLRGDPRVNLMEGINARTLPELPEPVGLAAVDVSFISLRLILPQVAGWLTPAGQVLALVKPQFEAGKENVGRGGVVRDPARHRQVLTGLIDWVGAIGLAPRGAVRSALKGAKGNQEFFLWLQRGGSPQPREALLAQAGLAQ